MVQGHCIAVPKNNFCKNFIKKSCSLDFFVFRLHMQLTQKCCWMKVHLMTRGTPKRSCLRFQKRRHILAVQTMWLLSQMKNGQTAAFPNSVIAEFSEESILKMCHPTLLPHWKTRVRRGSAEFQESSAALPLYFFGRGWTWRCAAFTECRTEEPVGGAVWSIFSEQLDQLTQSTEKTVDSSLRR